ncbi:hypothetical protein Franean1_6758 [Parafrankia sp. EAN1pec]|uniref:hypothetical protein n=1 Tax=Parafrankia sp. (strain EAN1pec) TaxID=298653 RepID=UPI00005436DB|nr:hypothetical protein Franean1_6758 [Frankia sp. EAN1pec]
MHSPTEAPGRFAGRTPADGRQPGPDPSSSTAVRRSGVGSAVVVGMGREPVTPAGDDAPSPPLPIRVPRTTWPAGRRRLSSTGRGYYVRPLSGPAGAAEQKWTVVVLDADGDPRETVTGFSSLEAADAYAELDPAIIRWISVPTRPAIPERIPGL